MVRKDARVSLDDLPKLERGLTSSSQGGTLRLSLVIFGSKDRPYPAGRGRQKVRAYVLLNNLTEGNAPMTIPE